MFICDYLSECTFVFQSFGIGYLKLHPDGQVRVHGEDPRPIIRVRPDKTSNFRRYGFVDAVLSLDPVGKLGLHASDYKVILPARRIHSFFTQVHLFAVI